MATNEPISTGGKLLFYTFFFIAGFFVFRWIIRLGLHLIGAYKHIAHSADSGSNLIALGLAAYCLYTIIAKRPSTVGISATSPTKATRAKRFHYRHPHARHSLHSPDQPV